MPAILLRRRKLGRGSCHGIRRNSDFDMKVCRNDVRNRRGYPQGYDVLFRWGCTDRVPDSFRMIVQPSEAITRVNNKREFRRQLQEHDQGLVPRTWFNQGDDVTFPCIVRPTHHAQGRRFYVCNNQHELRTACGRCTNGYYISALVNKASEYRVFVVQGRVACVAQKTPGDRDAVAWNVARGGRFDHVRWDDWPLQAVRKSVEAFNLSGLDFGGVDVMVDTEGNSYIIEINSAPSLPLKSDRTPTHRQECMAKCFDWIIQHGKNHIPLVDRRGGYRKFIHPAICDRAELD